MAEQVHGSSKSALAHPTNSRGREIHHGRTLAAWVGSMIAMVAIVVGGLALVFQNWPLFWGSVALLVVGIIAGKILQATGHGAS